MGQEVKMFRPIRLGDGHFHPAELSGAGVRNASASPHPRFIRAQVRGSDRIAGQLFVVATLFAHPLGDEIKRASGPGQAG